MAIADVPEVQEVRPTPAAGSDLLAEDLGVRVFGDGTRAAGQDSAAAVQGAARCPRCLDNGLTAFGETCPCRAARRAGAGRAEGQGEAVTDDLEALKARLAHRCP